MVDDIQRRAMLSDDFAQATQGGAFNGEDEPIGKQGRHVESFFSHPGVVKNSKDRSPISTCGALLSQGD